MPSNGLIAKIVLRDLDLLCDGNKFETLISLISGTTFVDLYLTTHGLIAKIVLHDLVLLFESKIFEMLASQKRCELLQKRMGWLLLILAYVIGTLQNLYSVILTNVFKVEI